MEELKPLGKTIGEVITLLYIYGAVLFFAVVVLAVLIIVYKHKTKKKQK